MKKIFLIGIGILISTIRIQAQSNQFDWARSLEGGVQSKCIAVDFNKNVYTTGYFGNGCAWDDFDPGPAVFYLVTSGGMDAFVSKLDSLGNFVWALGIGGGGSDRGISIALDQAGDVYVTGAFSGFVDFDPGSGTYYVSSTGLSDIFILKLSASGNFQWVKTMGAGGYDTGTNIFLDTDGNIYVAGSFAGVIDFDPDTASTATDTLIAAGGTDAFISKFDEFGNHIWAKRLGGMNTDDIQSISIDTSGNVITIGNFIDSLDCDPGPAIVNLIGTPSYTDIFISKLDSSGNFLWGKSMGGIAVDYGTSIATDNSGNVYSTGYYNHIVDFDPGPGLFNLTATSYPSTTFDNVFVSKLDP